LQIHSFVTSKIVKCRLILATLEYLHFNEAIWTFALAVVTGRGLLV